MLVKNGRVEFSGISWRLYPPLTDCTSGKKQANKAAIDLQLTSTITSALHRKPKQVQDPETGWELDLTLMALRVIGNRGTDEPRCDCS